jgi:hypothetical protein
VLKVQLGLYRNLVPGIPAPDKLEGKKELSENSLGHFFGAGSGSNYQIRKVGVSKPTRRFGGDYRYQMPGLSADYRYSLK